MMIVRTERVVHHAKRNSVRDCCVANEHTLIWLWLLDDSPDVQTTGRRNWVENRGKGNGVHAELL